jgi:two-component system NtrC family response regulator
MPIPLHEQATSGLTILQHIEHLPLIVQQQLKIVEGFYTMGDRQQANTFWRGIQTKYTDLKIPSIECEFELRKFITKNPEMLKLKDIVRRLAIENHPVIILGETGTGKETIARALHGNRVGNFVALNCTSLPDYLVESELFGHKKGSFTGAYEDKEGLLFYANKGTLFLDEIGDMPKPLQAKLLRALQEHKARPIGALGDIPFDTRVIAATHQNPMAVLREDLYWRLATFTLRILPLRNRREDIEPIAMKYGVEDPDDIEWKPLMDSLMEFSLLGNVRQLQSMITQYIFNME